MSEAGYVELPILQWLSGQDSLKPEDKGLGWTYRDEEAMAAFDRPLEDPLVEKLLVEAIIRINPEVTAVPDHSKQFWLTVQSLCPETERAKQWLCAHSHRVFLDLHELFADWR